MTAFTGVGPLIRFMLRRDRVFLPVWILAILGVVYASVAAVRRTYDTPEAIMAYGTNVGGSPAAVAMGGPPVALDRIGGILVYETSLTALIGVALMAAFTVVRHTRKEEDAGRVELLGSTVVSAHAVITAAVLVAAGASLLVGAGVTLSFLVEEQPVGESLLFGAAVAALGVVFTGVAACAAQLMSHGRGASGLSVAFLAVAFGFRAIGDVGENAWSWLSPMGWSQQVLVYDANRWWPLGLSLGFTAVLMLATVAFEGRRDLGSGVVPARPGPAEAGANLSGVVGLTWRLQRGALLAWVVGIWSMGLLLGSFSESIENMVEDNPTLRDFLGEAGITNVVEVFFAISLMLLAVGAGGFAVSSALRMRSEEAAGRVEPLLATAVSRSRFLAGGLLVTLAGAALAVGSGGLGVGMSYAVTSGDASQVWRMTIYGLAYLPGVLLLAAFAVLLVGWLPRISGLAWATVALTFVVGYLGDLLELPGWLVNLSPYSYVPEVPEEAMAMAPLAVLLGLTAVVVAAGWGGFLRRDIG